MSYLAVMPVIADGWSDYANLYHKTMHIMVLTITPTRTIGETQVDFAAAFPGLKLVFFSKPHLAHAGSPAKFLIDQQDLPLGELSHHMKTGYLLLEPEMVVWQLERLFEEEYGLHVQVFRKSGETWLETSTTDDITLEQQQAKVHASEHVHPEYIDPIDYREQD